MTFALKLFFFFLSHWPDGCWPPTCSFLSFFDPPGNGGQRISGFPVHGHVNTDSDLDYYQMLDISLPFIAGPPLQPKSLLTLIYAGLPPDYEWFLSSSSVIYVCAMGAKGITRPGSLVAIQQRSKVAVRALDGRTDGRKKASALSLSLVLSRRTHTRVVDGLVVVVVHLVDTSTPSCPFVFLWWTFGPAALYSRVCVEWPVVLQRVVALVKYHSTIRRLFFFFFFLLQHCPAPTCVSSAHSSSWVKRRAPELPSARTHLSHPQFNSVLFCCSRGRLLLLLPPLCRRRRRLRSALLVPLPQSAVPARHPNWE